MVKEKQGKHEAFISLGEPQLCSAESGGWMARIFKLRCRRVKWIGGNRLGRLEVK
jgi:hypothetical protein